MDSEKINECDIHSDAEDILGKEMAKHIRDTPAQGGILQNHGKQYQSVLQKMATSIGNNDEEYRQALLLSSFLSPDESDKATAAISECQRYGVPIKPIVDRVIARCGVKGATGGRIESIIEALTHQNFTANTSGGFNKMMGKNRKDSPLGND